MSYNPGLLFYKHYYEGIQFGKNASKADNEREFRKRNKTLVDTRFSSNALPAFAQSNGFQSFALTTTYPGLILGTGYAHGSGLEGEFKTGFYFDHTTGMPLIPGSSVKGLLRSAFPGLFYKKADKLEEADATKHAEAIQFWRKLGNNRKKFVASLLQALKIELPNEPDAILRLEREIFEGLHGANREKHEDHFAMRDRDIFYDAVITRSADGQVFSDEFITPHKNPLKNPVPVQILKVRPGVTFAFQFGLKADYQRDKEDGGLETVPRLLAPAQRLELFRQILMFLGAGAKTNSGFGHFEANEQVDLSGRPPAASAASTARSAPETQPAPAAPAQKKYPNLAYDKKLSGSRELVGELVRKEGDTAWFRLLNVPQYGKEVKASHPSVSRLEAGKHYPLSAGKVVPAEQVLEVKIGGFNPL